MAKVSIVGIGRLGLTVALCLEAKGFNVVGVDVSSSYVAKVNDKTLVTYEPGVGAMLAKATNLRATTILDEALTHSDLILIYVATPSTGDRENPYDHHTLSQVLLDINRRKVVNKHIVIGCTVMPGYVRQVGRFLLGDCQNTTLSYNPEFIAQGAIVAGVSRPDMLLIGEGSPAAGDRLLAMYSTLCENQPVVARMSPESAEICKLSVNCFITSKIAFANLIGDVADNTPGANKNDILRAVGADSRIGVKCLQPGFGFGGPCFPRDNRALAAHAEKVGVKPTVFRATDQANQEHLVNQVESFKLEVTPDKPIFLRGVTYKRDCLVPIIEESQVLAFGERLVAAGYQVVVQDSVPVIEEVQKRYGSLFTYQVMTP